MKIYLIAGEPSGDMLGARLMHALKELAPKAEFAGVGGENMKEEGLKSLFDISDLAVMGLAEVIPSIPKVLRRIRETVADIAARKPDIVVTIDSWSFSSRVHKALRRQKIKVPQMHYVAPQVWAWKKGRAKTMYKYVDRLLTLFPNEPAYFTPHRLPSDFVGHPVVENTVPETAAEEFYRNSCIPRDKRIVLILPGSRHNEVSRLLPVFLEAATLLRQKYADLQFVLPTVKTVERQVRDMVAENGADDVMIVAGRQERNGARAAAAAAMAASGTVSLELAIMKIPHIIAYKVAPLTAWLARHLLKIRSVNLPNILMNDDTVSELLQEACTPENVAREVAKFLDTENAAPRNLFQNKMEELRRLMGAGKINPSRRAAEIVLREIKGTNATSAAPDTHAVGTSVLSAAQTDAAAPATPPSVDPDASVTIRKPTDPSTSSTPHKTAALDIPTAPQKTDAPDAGGTIR